MKTERLRVLISGVEQDASNVEISTVTSIDPGSSISGTDGVLDTTLTFNTYLSSDLGVLDAESVMLSSPKQYQSAEVLHGDQVVFSGTVSRVVMNGSTCTVTATTALRELLGVNHVQVFPRLKTYYESGPLQDALDTLESTRFGYLGAHDLDVFRESMQSVYAAMPKNPDIGIRLHGKVHVVTNNTSRWVEVAPQADVFRIDNYRPDGADMYFSTYLVEGLPGRFGVSDGSSNIVMSWDGASQLIFTALGRTVTMDEVSPGGIMVLQGPGTALTVVQDGAERVTDYLPSFTGAIKTILLKDVAGARYGYVTANARSSVVRSAKIPGEPFFNRAGYYRYDNNLVRQGIEAQSAYETLSEILPKIGATIYMEGPRLVVDSYVSVSTRGGTTSRLDSWSVKNLSVESTEYKGVELEYYEATIHDKLNRSLIVHTIQNGANVAWGDKTDFWINVPDAEDWIQVATTIPAIYAPWNNVVRGENVALGRSYYSVTYKTSGSSEYWVTGKDYERYESKIEHVSPRTYLLSITTGGRQGPNSADNRYALAIPSSPQQGGGILKIPEPWRDYAGAAIGANARVRWTKATKRYGSYPYKKTTIPKSGSSSWSDIMGLRLLDWVSKSRAKANIVKELDTSYVVGDTITLVGDTGSKKFCIEGVTHSQGLDGSWTKLKIREV